MYFLVSRLPGLGEVGLALKSFQVGLHLNPADEELRHEDLDWARHLLNQVLDIDRMLLKEQCHKIFDPRFFLSHDSNPTAHISIRVITSWDPIQDPFVALSPAKSWILEENHFSRQKR